MGLAKAITIRPIDSKSARSFVARNHYSGKTVNNSQIHFGVFYEDKLEGVLQYGPSMRKEFILPLVTGTEWNQTIELNRMAFTDKLPRNSESRAIGITLKMLKKNCPQLKWVISFADACQCGDGTIYRASGFVLTHIKKNIGTRINPKTGEKLQQMAAYHAGIVREFIREWIPIDGFMMRYIYFLDPTWASRLTVPIIPFSDIKKMNAAMYKGAKHE